MITGAQLGRWGGLVFKRLGMFIRFRLVRTDDSTTFIKLSVISNNCGNRFVYRHFRRANRQCSLAKLLVRGILGLFGFHFH